MAEPPGHYLGYDSSFPRDVLHLGRMVFFGVGVFVGKGGRARRE